MTSEEKELEIMIESMEVDKALRTPPMFEMYITLFSIGLSVILFLFPNMLADGNTYVYEWMTRIMPQNGWAFLFFVAGLLKAAGLLFNKNGLRYAGLILSAFIYLGLTVCYSVAFPTMGSIQFGCMSLFSILSISVVKHTGIEK